jgi:hypothetical protein
MAEDREHLMALYNNGERSKSTVKVYTDAMLRLRRMGINMHDADETMDLLKALYKPTTQNVYVTAIICYIKATEPVDKALLGKFTKALQSNQAQIENGYDLTALTEAQQANKVTWDELISHRDSLQDCWGRHDVYKYLLLCLYTKIPPKRNDWADVWLTEQQALIDMSADQKYNWYNVRTQELVLNRYKTAKTYGSKVIKMPDDLHKDILLSCDKLKLLENNDPQPLFIHQDGKPWSRNYMSQFWRRVMPGKALGVSLIRKIAKTTWMENGIGQSDRLAWAMDHSVVASHRYYDNNARQSADDNCMGIHLP